MICWDHKVKMDDIISPAYVTNSGDVFCRVCGMEYDRREEEDDYLGWNDYYPGVDQDVRDS
jgi:hypothetical protein